MPVVFWYGTVRSSYNSVHRTDSGHNVGRILTMPERMESSNFHVPNEERNLEVC